MTTTPDGRVQPHRVRWLGAAVVAVSVLTALVGLATGAGPVGTGVVVGALAVFLVVWFAVGREAERTGRLWAVPIVALVLVCAVGTVATPAFATFQFIAFTLAWLLTPGIPTGVTANSAVAIAIGVPYALGTSIPEAIGVEGISLVFAITMGVWISRIEERSQERQRLVDRLTAAQEDIAVLNREAGTVAERERLSRELHDTLTQSVAGIVMLAERASARHPADQTLSVLEDAARQALAEARAIVAGGANVPLDGGLAGALATLADRFRRETGLRVEIDVDGEAPRGLEVVLLRCAQEALANVRKHAGAKTVGIRFAADDEVATLTVTDDGAGPGGGSGFGIAGMRDRLALVGGDVDLVPGPAGGARLVVRAPITAEVTA